MEDTWILWSWINIINYMPTTSNTTQVHKTVHTSCRLIMQQRHADSLVCIWLQYLGEMNLYIHTYITAVSGFIEQNQKHNYHQLTPSQPPHNPSKFKQLACRDTCLLADIYPFICIHYPVQNQVIASRWMHIKCVCYLFEAI